MTYNKVCGRERESGSYPLFARALFFHLPRLEPGDESTCSYALTVSVKSLYFILGSIILVFDFWNGNVVTCFTLSLTLAVPSFGISMYSFGVVVSHSISSQP